MKKIVASVGLVALGASGIQSASAQALTGPDTSKPWTIGATLRGFYDSNPATVPNDISIPDRESFGFEIAPAASLVWNADRTSFNLGVLYSLKYYDNIPYGSTGHDDQSFSFGAGVNHQFNEQLKLRVNDSFVIGQEPDLLRAGYTYATFQRVSGDNMRNYGSIGFDAQLTPKFGLGLGYDNSWYDYDDMGYSLTPSVFPFFGAVVPSTGGLLNRIDQRAHLEGLLQLQPETKGLLGYQFSYFNYTGDELISGYVFTPTGTIVDGAYSDIRNSMENTIYLGVEQNFSPQLTGALRAGASYTDYPNDPNADNVVTPYVNLNVKYAYGPDSTIQAGFSYDRSPTDVAYATAGGQVTLDTASAVAFLALNHHIAGKLYGSLMFQFQNSTFNGGAYDGQDQQYYLLGLNLEYRISQYFAAEVGYNYDVLASDIPYGGVTSAFTQGFTRNRVYIGLTASY